MTNSFSFFDAYLLELKGDQAGTFLKRTFFKVDIISEEVDIKFPVVLINRLR